MANFQWRTDDEELTDPQDLSPGGGPDRRRVVYVLLFVIVLAAGGYGLYRSYRGVEEHLAETTERVEAEVRASHNVVQSAANRADSELFVRFLSGADARWSATQEQLVAGEAWLHRPGLGLEWQPAQRATEPGTAITVSLSSDLTEAILQSRETYRLALPGGEGRAERVELEQTAVYRLGPDRWLYAPPEAEFWGETRELSLSRLELIYPARDEGLVTRLAADLNGLVAQVCDGAGGECPDDFRLQVQFGRDPALLLPEAARILPTWAERLPGLPAPTLVGLPVDEAGYQALYAVYARQVASSALVTLSGWQCCVQGLFVQALLDVELQALGLAPLTPEASDVRRLASRQRVGLLSDFGHLWSRSPALEGTAQERRALAAAQSVVAFLLEREPDQDAAALLHALADADSYEAWLADVTGVTSPELSLSWRSFLYDAAQTTEGGASGAGEASLLALCVAGAGEDGGGEEGVLLAFDDADEPVVVSGVEGLAGMEPTSRLSPYGPGGALLAAQGAAGERLKLFLWRAGQGQPIWDSGEGPDAGYQFQFVGSSPDGAYIVIEEVVAERQLNIYRVAEMARCLEGNCRWRRSIYRPLWSPDDAYVINTRSNLLFLTGSRSFVQPYWYLDYGSSPFWLDEDSFGYVQHTREGQFASVVLGAVGHREIQTVVGSNQLQPLLPPGTIMAASVEPLAHPLTGDIFFLAAPAIRSGTPAPTYVFAISRENEDEGYRQTLLFAADDVAPGSLLVSPSGRWLSAQTAEGLVVYDVVRDRSRVLAEVRPEGPTVWARDGSRLFVPGAGGSWLVAPGDDYRSARVGHEGVCREAVWVSD
ncbi:MAG TPA: hypothetical protein VK879_03595 [Candidatus Sulfomarinibacteraceae bacterium]|nr:hypothetical protein [Candidatus Sulfomarinibacteraceae bacterium]